MTPADILDWKTIGPAALSADGKWLAYRFSPVQGDSEVIVRATEGDRTLRFPMGEIPPAQPGAPPGPPPGAAPTPASAVAFSDDGRFVAFTAYPTRKEAAALRKQRKPVQTRVKLIDLSTGAEIEYPKVRRFAFSGESSRAIALHRYGPDAPAPGGGAPSGGGSAGAAATPSRPKGADLIVRDLATGTELTLGHVAEFAFDKPGRSLAWTIDAEDQVGNGVHVRNLETGIVAPLDSGKASYEQIWWSEDGEAFAVVKGVEDKAFTDKRGVVVGFTGMSGRTPVRTIYDPAADASFPAGMTVSLSREPRWTDDRQGLLFGIVPLRPKDKDSGKGDAEKTDESGSAPAPRPGGDADDKPDLVVWHWKDGRLQSQQQVQEDRDKRFSYLATYRVADKRFIRLADDELREVTVPRKGRWAVGSQRTPYELTASLEGRNYQDVYAVDLQTGERKLAVKQVRWFYGQSPDSTKFLYYGDGHFHVFDAATARTTNVTLNAPVSFVNVEDDHNVVKPPVPPEGWTADSAAVLLGDLWDVWRVAADGSGAVNLTGNGRRDEIRYDLVSGLDPDEHGVDLTKPQYFLTLGEWTKKGGVARVAPGASGAEMLRWDDAGYGRLMKAKRADTFVFARETSADFPDLHVAGASLKEARRLTEGRTQAAAFTWSAGPRLVDYTSDKGKRLQAALYLPANYEPGKRYPTIVYIYEHLSDGFNRFAQPTANGFNKSVYTSNGYAVLMPDISYTVNDPGMSAVWCVLPALRAAQATGVVDPARVGLHGHSWGGYQTSFLITQTTAFKAAVAGAPLTNMVSMYSLVYKNTGGGNMAIFESSQGRFRGGYWDNWEAYVRNSPIAFASRVTTPLLMLHNDKDGAVDFTQGVEYYNTLRRLKKPVVMLQYVGENHGLVKPANRFDYTVRMKEFFDHHLKGEPAPAWWTEGVPRLKMDEHLKTRQPAPKPPVQTTTTAGGAR
jgi:dipeptidyl aminopeptidase/acylaminoacyl peptidase